MISSAIYNIGNLKIGMKYFPNGISLVVRLKTINKTQYFLRFVENETEAFKWCFDIFVNCDGVILDWDYEEG